MENKIFDHKPKTWQELEEMVCQAFNEMGYKCEKNYEISTVRGKVKVDLFAVDERTPIPTIVLCECKYWNKPVEQSVVHSFRSVCADIGAHYGLIISKKGFQAGAKATRESTNIHLLNFDQFQSTFFEEWRKGVFMILSGLSDRLLPLLRMETSTIKNLTTNEKTIFLSNFFIKYSIFFGDQRFTKFFIEKNIFPIDAVDPKGDPCHLNKITISTPREFLEIAKAAVSDACKYYGI